MFRSTIATRGIVVVLTSLVLCLPARAEEAGDGALPQETTAERNQRMAWWRDARFGMFIHWGVYAVPAGEWKGQKLERIAEWIQDAANIPKEEYEQLAPQFDPSHYDPEAWAQMAQDAGMKYVVITSKHHDGFCLFDTAATDWDVVDASPYGKDLLKPLAEACRKRGIQFCVYYSILDWHHPSQSRDGKDSHATKMKGGEKREYVDYMKRQLAELMNSCSPEVIWFDGEWPEWWTEKDGRDLYSYLRELKPAVIVNNRVGKGRKGMSGMNKEDQQYAGDFGTPEQEIPATGMGGVDWESCMTMNTSWGYKWFDEDWKSTKSLIQNLVDITSKGGNYLLNVGPKADGTFPQESIDRLKAIGKWMEVNGQSIYGTVASPFGRPDWGRYTLKTTPHDRTLYAHVFEWPQDGTLVIPELTKGVKSARLLAGGETLKVETGAKGAVIHLPSTPPSEIDSVIELSLSKE